MEVIPAHTTNANFTLSLYSSLPTFMRTYAYAASSSASEAVISAMSPVPVPASLRLSDVAEAYCDVQSESSLFVLIKDPKVQTGGHSNYVCTFSTSHVVSDLSDRTSS